MSEQKMEFEKDVKRSDKAVVKLIKLTDNSIECNIVGYKPNSIILKPIHKKKSIKRVQVPYEGKKLKILNFESDIETQHIQKISWKDKSGKTILEDTRTSNPNINIGDLNDFSTISEDKELLEDILKSIINQEDESKTQT